MVHILKIKTFGDYGIERDIFLYAQPKLAVRDYFLKSSLSNNLDKAI